MCEILIKASDAVNTDTIKNRTGCYKRGMPIVVFEDGHIWGREESKQQWILEGNTSASWPSQGKFVIVKIPTAPVPKAQALLDLQTEDDLGVETGGLYRRRRWQLLVNSLPLAVRNTLATNGEVTVTVAQIRAYLQRIRDAAQYIGLD